MKLEPGALPQMGKWKGYQQINPEAMPHMSLGQYGRYASSELLGAAANNPKTTAGVLGAGGLYALS